MASTTPLYQSLMDQARAAVAELDAEIATVEAAIEQHKARLGELREQRRPIAAILAGGPRPGRKPKPSSAVDALAAAIGHACECGRVFEVAQGLSMHRTRAGHPVGFTPPVTEAPDEEPPAAAAVVEETPSLLERDVRRLWERHAREPEDMRVQLIADAVGKRTQVVRETCRHLGLTA